MRWAHAWKRIGCPVTTADGQMEPSHWARHQRHRNLHRQNGARRTRTSERHRHLATGVHRRRRSFTQIGLQPGALREIHAQRQPRRMWQSLWTRPEGGDDAYCAAPNSHAQNRPAHNSAAQNRRRIWHALSRRVRKAAEVTVDLSIPELGVAPPHGQRSDSEASSTASFALHTTSVPERCREWMSNQTTRSQPTGGLDHCIAAASPSARPDRVIERAPFGECGR